MSRDSLVDVLEAANGVTCVVGAGGKKSTLYALAAQLERAIVTATVRIPPFESSVNSFHSTEEPLEAVEKPHDWPLGLVATREGERCTGYDLSVIDELATTVSEPILVKADGARTRWFKAPNEMEPQIPTSATTVVPISSVRIVGEPLDDRLVHRPERVADLTGLEVGDRVTTTDVATVLMSARGGLKHVPETATVVPLLNMADTPALERTAREIATEIFKLESHPQREPRHRVPRVVITNLLEESPVVDVIERL